MTNNIEIQEDFTSDDVFLVANGRTLIHIRKTETPRASAFVCFTLDGKQVSQPCTTKKQALNQGHTLAEAILVAEQAEAILAHQKTLGKQPNKTGAKRVKQSK